VKVATEAVPVPAEEAAVTAAARPGLVEAPAVAPEGPAEGVTEVVPAVAPAEVEAALIGAAPVVPVVGLVVGLVAWVAHPVEVARQAAPVEAVPQVEAPMAEIGAAHEIRGASSNLDNVRR